MAPCEDTAARGALNIPIFAVIVCATVLSTTSSLAGGLVIYFQGLDALEESIQQTSLSEVRSLREGILQVDEKVIDLISTIKQFYFSEKQINSTNTLDWTERMNTLFFAQVNSSSLLYYAAVFLHDYGARNESNPIYATVWSDLRSNGSKELVLGECGPFLSPNMKDGNMLVDVFSLDAKTGRKKAYLYKWNAGIAGYGEDGETYTIDPHNDVLSTGTGYVPAVTIPHAHAERKTGPRLWHSPTKDYLYGYHSIDAMYHPPPPPHPWSQYRAVRITVGYLSSAFSEVFAKHKNIDGVTILYVNRENARVLGTTIPSYTVIPTECEQLPLTGEEAEAAGCYKNLTHHFGMAHKEAFEILGRYENGKFLKASLGGQEHFIRKEHVVDSLELIWMRPVSSVEGKVTESLNLLVMFVLVVLFIDAFTSVAEIIFIALPLRDLSKAITLIGNMQTGDAQHPIESYVSRAVMVKEIRLLMIGMFSTILRLEEFKTFIPEAVLFSNEQHRFNDGEDNPERVSLHTVGVVRVNPLVSHPDSDVSSFSSSKVSFHSQEDGLGLYVAVKRSMSLMALNVVAWGSHFAGTDDIAFMSNHADMVTAVIDMCVKFAGALYSFQGDRFQIGWNTVKRATDVVTKSIYSSLYIHQQLEKIQLSCAIGHGKGRVGNIGNACLRRFTIISPMLAWVCLLEMYGKDNGLSTTTDSSVFPYLQNRFSFRVVDGAVHNKAGHVVPIGEIKGKLKAQTNDWMYHLVHNSSEDDIYAESNAFALAVIRKDWVGLQSTAYQQHRDDIFYPAYQQQEFIPHVFTNRRHDPETMCFTE